MSRSPQRRRLARRAPAALVLAAALVSRPTLAQPPSAAASSAQPARGAFSLADVRSYPFPSELVAAAKAPRIAWVFNEEGRRNIYVADAPVFAARKLTSFDRDDGQEMSSVSLSADGRFAVFVRGGDHDANWDGTLPVNPTSSPVAPVVAVWIAPTDGSAPHAIGDGDTPTISPRNDVVAYVRDRQIWSAPLDGSSPARRLFVARGDLREPVWSPDGSQLAFVADRGDHAFIGVYVNDSTPIQWLAPTTSRDAMPRWSPDGRQVAFVRRPGIGGAPESVLTPPPQAWRIVVADAATGAGRTVWKSPATPRGGYPRVAGGANLMYGANGRLVFLSYEDGWPHLYTVSDRGGSATLLTPGAFTVETMDLSVDGRMVVASANAGATPDDIDRRHLLRVALDNGTMRVLTPGTGLEFAPVFTADGRTTAFLGGTAQQPPLPMVMPSNGGASRSIAADRLPTRFPLAQLVVPRTVSFQSADGFTIRAQLFERSGGPSKKPALVFGHGGPERQMLLGWHYREYYAGTYAENQYLASLGYVVLSVNYRLGIGYGFDFHRAANGWSRGASEYRDILAAGEYLRTLPQVDAPRIGIFGGSYGGFLTAMALAKNSDLFAVGVDMYGPSDWTADNASRIGGLTWDYEKGDRAEAADVAWKASPVAYVDTWRSPVLFIHGDDDRNTRFYHTTDLVRRLEPRGVPYEELIIPDDTHHWLRHSNAIRVWQATADFLGRYLKPVAP